MAGSIGGVSCTFVRGTIPQGREESERWRMPGINGYGIALLGLGDSEFKLRAVFYSNDAGVDLWASNLQTLQGQIVTVINDHGDTSSSVYLERVGNCVKEARQIPGSSVTKRGEIELDCVIV